MFKFSLFKKVNYKKMILISLILLTLSFIIMLLIYNDISTKSKPFIIKDLNSAPEVQAVLVLGARVYSDGSLSPVLEDRVIVGINLYKLGKAKKIIFSGDHRKEHYDEPNAMKRYAEKKGVPQKDIFLDHAGFRTFDSLYRAKEVFKLKSVIVVTQEFHLGRSIYIGKKLGLNVYGMKSDRRTYQKHWVNHIREFLARTLAFSDLFITNRKPHFLGPTINIHGNGNQTHDK